MAWIDNENSVSEKLCSGCWTNQKRRSMKQEGWSTTIIMFSVCNLNGIFLERWICKYTEVQLRSTRITTVFYAESDDYYSVNVWANAAWAHRVERFLQNCLVHLK